MPRINVDTLINRQQGSTLSKCVASLSEGWGTPYRKVCPSTLCLTVGTLSGLGLYVDSLSTLLARPHVTCRAFSSGNKLFFGDLFRQVDPSISCGCVNSVRNLKWASKHLWMCVLVNGAVSVNVQLISAGPHQCRIESSERLHQPCVVAGFVVIFVDHAIELCFRLAVLQHGTAHARWRFQPGWSCQ